MTKVVAGCFKTESDGRRHLESVENITVVSLDWNLIQKFYICLFREYPDWLPFCHIWYNDSVYTVVRQVSEFGEAGYPLGGYHHEGDKENLLDAFLLSWKALEAR